MGDSRAQYLDMLVDVIVELTVREIEESERRDAVVPAREYDGMEDETRPTEVANVDDL